MTNIWNGKRVLVTGHTGFKGSWLSLMLRLKGAQVHGLSLPPSTKPDLHSALVPKLGYASSHLLDIADSKRVDAVVNEIKPEVVFHLAAQPIVKTAAENPLETIRTNVLGTANLLDALRRLTPRVQGVVVVTTDKVYENQGWDWGYRENDQLGADEIYSASKSGADLVAQAYNRFFDASRICTARAGNVIGGGDWSDYRLVPDIVRAWQSKTPLVIRRPEAVRPWQHVLEPAAFYIRLAELLVAGRKDVARSWNWGPELDDTATVREICRGAKEFLDFKYVEEPSDALYEAQILRLDCSLAKIQLGARCRLDLRGALAMTFNWYRSFYAGQDAYELMASQISEFDKLSTKTIG